MKPSPFAYYRPRSKSEALETLNALSNAKILAGGQSLVPMMNMRYAAPDALVDINRIPDLDGIAIAGDRASIGATTRQRAMEIDEGLFALAPIFRDALAHVGHRQTRNRGTFGGSLCHLDSAAELPLLAVLYDAELLIESAGGARQAAIADFILGQMTPALGEGELLSAIAFQAWRGGGYAFLEHARRRGDFALACAACLIEADESGIIERAAIAVGGLSEIPFRLRAAELRLVGRRGSREEFEAAARECLDRPALADIHASGDFRRSIAATLVRRALDTAFARALSRGQTDDD